MESWFFTVFLFLYKYSYSFSVDMQNILITYKKTTQKLNARIPGSNTATDDCMLYQVLNQKFSWNQNSILTSIRYSLGMFVDSLILQIFGTKSLVLQRGSNSIVTFERSSFQVWRLPERLVGYTTISILILEKHS